MFVCANHLCSEDYVSAVSELDALLCECYGQCKDKAVDAAMFEDVQVALSSAIER